MRQPEYLKDALVELDNAGDVEKSEHVAYHTDVATVFALLAIATQLKRIADNQ